MTDSLYRSRVIGLPRHITTCLFDLDGVLTETASVHRAAWKKTFDAVIHEEIGDQAGEFTDDDYARYVDGRPRYDGVRAFLASRDIGLPEGSAEDSPDTRTIQGVGNRKNDLLVATIEQVGVTAYTGSVRYLHAVREAGLAIGVVTSSANATALLDGAGLTEFVQTRVDGNVISQRGLAGKPAPDSFLAAADALAVPPGRAAVYEDALAGVAAARAGNFGYVIGVNRQNQADALRDHGADIVVDDLAELLQDQEDHA